MTQHKEEVLFPAQETLIISTKYSIVDMTRLGLRSCDSVGLRFAELPSSLDGLWVLCLSHMSEGGRSVYQRVIQISRECDARAHLWMRRVVFPGPWNIVSSRISHGDFWRSGSVELSDCAEFNWVQQHFLAGKRWYARVSHEERTSIKNRDTHARKLRKLSTVSLQV